MSAEVLDLHPVSAAARAIGPVSPFRDNALGAERTRMSEDGLAVALEVLGKPDAGAASECRATNLPRMTAQVFAVKFEQVEGEQEDGAGTAASRQSGAQPPKSVRPRSSLAVEGSRCHWKRQHRLDNPRHLIRPILAVARERAHAAAIASGNKPVAVVLHLERPARAFRHVA